MKKVTIALGLILISAIAFSQPKLTKNSDGNYVMQKSNRSSDTDSLTEIKVLCTDGNEYPLYVTKNKKYYIVRTSKKTGNQYKQYLKIDN